MNKIVEFILDLIYPPKCAFCRKLIGTGHEGLCPECTEKLPRLSGTDAKSLLEDGTLCYSALRYDQMVRDSFLRYKFYGSVSYADTYSRLMAECLKETAAGIDIVTWVPLSRKRKRKRGYDQAELLANGTSLLLGLDCKGILYKNKETKAQSLTKSRNERKSNIKGAYTLRKEADIKGKMIIIVDDIITTGATLSECCAVLKKAGAASVTAATFAKAAR